MAKHNIKTKYIFKQQINYKEEDEIINKPWHVQNSNVTNIKQTKMVQLISQDQGEIPAYNIDDNQKRKSKDSYLNW